MVQPGRVSEMDDDQRMAFAMVSRVSTCRRRGVSCPPPTWTGGSSTNRMPGALLFGRETVAGVCYCLDYSSAPAAAACCSMLAKIRIFLNLRAQRRWYFGGRLTQPRQFLLARRGSGCFILRILLLPA